MRELFNQTEIDSNRQGKLTPEQMKFIQDAVDPKTWVWGTLITLSLGVLGGGCLATIGAANVFGILGPILGIAFLFCAYRWFTMWSLRRKLLSAPVTVAEGSVTFKKLDMLDAPRYSPETFDGKRLHPQGLAGLNVMLPPGDYRFYYLPPRNWLLSAEPLSTEEEMKANLIEVLGQVFGFDPGDLDSLRIQAASGDAKMVEGQPQIETPPPHSTTDETISSNVTYAAIGGIKFRVPNEAASAFIPELSYRVYYYEKEPANFFSKIINMLSNTYIAAIEPL